MKEDNTHIISVTEIRIPQHALKRMCFQHVLSPLRLMLNALPPRRSSTWFCKSKWFVSSIYRWDTDMQILDIKLSIWNSEAKGSVDMAGITSYVENSSPYNIIPAWRYECYTMRHQRMWSEECFRNTLGGTAMCSGLHVHPIYSLLLRLEEP
jgi:hypothetical protein